MKNYDEKDIMKTIKQVQEDIKDSKILDALFQVVSYHLYGIYMEVPENLNDYTTKNIQLKFTVPEYSEIKLNEQEASGDYLIREFAAKLRSSLPNIEIKLLAAIRKNETWTYQDAAQILPSVLSSAKTSAQKVSSDEFIHDMLQYKMDDTIHE